jgi:hypothetical protein
MGVPYPSRSSEIIRDITIIAAATFPIVALRFVSRGMVSNKIEWDDCAVVVAAVSLTERNLAAQLLTSLNSL